MRARDDGNGPSLVMLKPQPKSSGSFGTLYPGEKINVSEVDDGLEHDSLALRPPSSFSDDVIVVDPPWDFVNCTAAGARKGAGPHCDVMALADVRALPIGRLARQDAILVLWG